MNNFFDKNGGYFDTTFFKRSTKILFFLWLINYSSHYLQAQPMQLTWVTTVNSETELTDEKLPIEVLISGKKIDKDSVFVLLNNERVGQKADIVKLGQLNKSQTKFSYLNAVALNEGKNEIKVGVALPDGSMLYSLPKLIQKEGDIITEIVRNHNEGGKGIFWQSPRWQSNPLVLDKRHLSMKVIINSPVQIKKKDIYLVRQQIVKVPIAPDSKLKELSPGKYEFTNTMQLEGEGLIDVIIKIKSPIAGTIESDPLIINFSPFKPNIHLLSVGTQTDLDYTMNDAKDFAAIFKSQSQAAGGKLFNTVTVNTLVGEAASATAIKTAIEKLETKFKNGNIGRRDLIVLYLSSHGFLDKRSRLRIQGDDYDPGAWRTTSVAYERDIIEILDEIPCKKLIFIDACHSGGGGAKGDDKAVQYLLEQLNKDRKGVTTIASSSGSESSYEDEAWQNGAFTESILEGMLNGRADQDRNQLITINELWYYIKERVPFLVQSVKEKAQHPQLIANELGDVAIFSIK